MDDREKFFPLIEGASVPMRRHIEVDGEGRMIFAMSGGDGNVDGVPFVMRGGIDCSIEVSFRPKGEAEASFYLDPRDFVRAAFDQWKRDREAKQP